MLILCFIIDTETIFINNIAFVILLIINSLQITYLIYNSFGFI
jgi:hypothetical protein